MLLFCLFNLCSFSLLQPPKRASAAEVWNYVWQRLLEESVETYLELPKVHWSSVCSIQARLFASLSALHSFLQTKLADESCLKDMRCILWKAHIPHTYSQMHIQLHTSIIHTPQAPMARVWAPTSWRCSPLASVNKALAPTSTSKGLRNTVPEKCLIVDVSCAFEGLFPVQVHTGKARAHKGLDQEWFCRGLLMHEKSLFSFPYSNSIKHSHWHLFRYL